MRILHMCQRDDPDTGGSLRVAEALVREQRAAGLEAWLLFLYGEPAGVSASLAPHTVNLGMKSSKEVLFGIGKLRKIITRIAPDVIHSHDGIIWPRLAFLDGRFPIVMHTHLPIVESSEIKDLLGRVLVKNTTRSLIGISLHTIETWVKGSYPASKIHYVPNGVDFDRFAILDREPKRALRDRLGLPREKRILLWVGRIHSEMKGADRVERIADLLPDDMVLVVVGNGPDFEAMQASCAKPIADGRMLMTGSISVPELYYQAADEYLFTSYHEPFGLVILEAVASGLPILAFRVNRGGGAVKLLDEFGATMIENDASDAVLQSLLQHDPARFQLVAKNCERALRQYAWSSVSAKVTDIYKLVLNRNI